jgi:hypothetical protein
MADSTIDDVRRKCNLSDAAKEKRRAYQKAWYEANRERIAAAYAAQRDTVRERQRAHYAANPDAYAARRATYYEKNRAAILAQKREAYQSDPEAKLARDKAYREAHAQKIAEKVKLRRGRINAARKMRYHSCAKFRLRMAISAAVAQSIETGKSGASWETLVGYTAKELMAHLERQFTKGMSWRNRSLWHIDHIIPVASFDFSSPEDAEFKACWALYNLRPIWAKENLSKNSKRLLLI